MPYKSKAQQGYLHAKLPRVAAEFDKATPKSAFKKLPAHAKKRTPKK